MHYINTRTKQQIDVLCEIQGDDWVSTSEEKSDLEPELEKPKPKTKKEA